MKTRFLIWRLGVACFIAAIPACGSGGPRLNPVQGTVHYEGNPAEGATVILDPVSGSSDFKPTGVVGADGRFTVQTPPHGAGAPGGEYAVLVTWYPSNARGLGSPKNKLPAKYGDRATTPIPKITVKDGSNNLDPIQLTAK
ncbi:hypothetical protein [Limnoglobus roseus]|uniref:Carboxypeptidase regulatory-like domain-containing protein n=1 Tax=Limnoglobus roseus TaxID=2598579 RepID=A0A5C1ALU1_9BACT|nr:hypothetical protein [Limnoglobus roseus]QEL19930.1 carboxypeptidase regulatory-like domain-containing protein [Limnoglobus roseus]